MIKHFLIAAALLIASPVLVFSQDLFVSFDSASAMSATTGAAGTSGTAYIFSDEPFAFDVLDLNITSSDSAKLLLTGGASFNDPFLALPGSAFNSSVVSVDPSGANGRLFAENVTQNGIDPAVSSSFNPHFETGVGPNGAVLLAELHYDLVGSGDVSLDLSLGLRGARLGAIGLILTPDFGSGTVTVVPEPSSAALLILGAVGMVARRRRARA